MLNLGRGSSRISALEPMVLQLWNRLSTLPLKHMKIRSGRQMQLSLSLFSTMSDVHCRNLPLNGTSQNILEGVIKSQISTAPEAFRGLRELTLDIYDHDYAQASGSDNSLSVHNFLPDVLRAASASLQRLELNFTTPGEVPHSMCRDICLFHGVHFTDLPLERTGKVPYFDRIVPQDIEFVCLESMKMTNVYYSGQATGAFLAKHTRRLRQSHLIPSCSFDYPY